MDVAVLHHSIVRHINAHTVYCVPRPGTRQVDGVVVNLAVGECATVDVNTNAIVGRAVGDVAGDFGGVGGDFAVVERAILADIGSAAIVIGAGRTAADGKAVEQRGIEWGEVCVLVQHATGIGTEQDGLVHIGLCTVAEVVVCRLVADKASVGMYIGLDFKTVFSLHIAGVSTFFYIEAGGEVDKIAASVHGLL